MNECEFVFMKCGLDNKVFHLKTVPLIKDEIEFRGIEYFVKNRCLDIVSGKWTIILEKM